MLQSACNNAYVSAYNNHYNSAYNSAYNNAWTLGLSVQRLAEDSHLDAVCQAIVHASALDSFCYLQNKCT